MLQEIIPGPEESLVQAKIYIDSRGELLSKIMYRKIRQSPSRLGVIRVGETVPYDQEIHNAAKRIIDRAEYQGYIGVEFKRDERDMRWKLIEVNVRIGRCTSLLQKAGVDLPWLIYQDKVMDEQHPIDAYSEAVWIDIVPDLLNLVVRDHKFGFSTRSFFAPYLVKHRSWATWSISDPMPFIKGLLQIFSRAGHPRSWKTA
jgi:predicted ATP-grasp superfamily ATP-dependent carboligase